jgi:hypothetical protein
MRTNMTVLLAAVGWCVGLTPAGAGELAANEVPAQANWVVHLNHEAFLGSRIGELIQGELKAQGADKQLESFATIFGFHPLNDVRDVTLYGLGQDQEKAVVLVDGRFDTDKLLAVVQMNPQHKEIPHHGVTIHRWLQEDDKKEGKEATSRMMYGAIHEGRLVAMSAGLDAVKSAVDTLKSPTAGAAAGLSERTSARDGAFFQVVGTGVGAMVGDEPKAALLRETEALTLTAGDNGGNVFIELALEGASMEVTENMTKMLEGMIALAKLAAQEQPKLAALAEQVRISSAGKTTQARFEADAQTVFDFLKKQWEQNQQQQKAAQES